MKNKKDLKIKMLHIAKNSFLTQKEKYILKKKADK